MMQISNIYSEFGFGAKITLKWIYLQHSVLWIKYTK